GRGGAGRVEVAVPHRLADPRVAHRGTTGHLAGAGLDVFAVEPLPANDPLTELDNVILTPHWNASTRDVWRATGDTVTRSVLAVSRGELPAHIVNPEVLGRPGFQRKLERWKPV
ncbi:MAG: NAD(P)-dependent oxidoreductase, partial [Planctomycetaceae bacterium]